MKAMYNEFCSYWIFFNTHPEEKYEIHFFYTVFPGTIDSIDAILVVIVSPPSYYLDPFKVHFILLNLLRRRD